jgi:o-succinylbenzoate synthase
VSAALKISEIRARTVVLENTTLRTSYGSNVTKREHLFVSVRSDQGDEGVGEGSPLPHFSGERAPEMLGVTRDVLAPALLGRDPFDTEGASVALDRALPHHQASKAALVNALVDLQGRASGLSAHQLLGGKVREALPLAGAVGIEEPEQVLASVGRLFERGIRTFKLKVGSDVERDVRVLHALRERFGMDVKLRADANSGLGRSEALRFLRLVEDVQLQYLEQPLRREDLVGLARLRERSTTPIAVDESLFGLSDALDIIRGEAADVFIIKLIKLGGLHGARKVISLAQAAGIACVAVSPYETAVGVAANIHLAASSAAFPFAAELGAGVSEVRLPGASELRYDRGNVMVPSEPGLGVDLPPGFFETAQVVSEAVGK